jgi:hypothetical protein
VHRAVTVLSQIGAMWKNMRDLAKDLARPATADDIPGFGHAREMTKISEQEIHEALLSCTRARRQLMHSLPAVKANVALIAAALALVGSRFSPAAGVAGCCLTRDSRLTR